MRGAKSPTPSAWRAVPAQPLLGYKPGMRTLHHVTGILAAMLFVTIVAGCTHQASASAQVSDGLQPFTWTRNQTVALVAHNKRTLAPADINSLTVAYTDLQEKANAYASFMVEAVTTSSFDPARNAQCASDFEKAIAAFDKAYNSINATRYQVANTAWVTSFAQTLQARWTKYGPAVAQMSPQTKADFIAEVKRDTVWPNYENIATEPVAVRP